MIVLAIVGYIVIGPERSRDVALTLGRWLRAVMKSPWWKEANQIGASLRDLPTTLVRMADLEDEVRAVRTDIGRATHIDYNSPAGPAGADPLTRIGNPDVDPWGVQSQPPTAPTPPAPSAKTDSSPFIDDEQTHDS